MLIFRGGEFNIDTPTAVALGSFDGLHIGHRKLIYKAKLAADRLSLPLCVWTFNSRPNSVLCKGKLILSCEKRLEIFERLGVDICVLEEFENIKNKSCEDFVDDILINKLKAEYIVCGFNYTFGKNASGNAEILRYLTSGRAQTEIIPPVIDSSNNTVSSSLIREYVSQGKIEKANALLGEEYEITSVIKSGKGLGRKLGFPTVNQSLDTNRVTPKYGVYASKVVFDSKEYKAVTNIGVRPTVENTSVAECESFIFDFDGSLYGKSVTAKLVAFLREEKKFSSNNELIAQIKRDAQNAKKFFEKE